jgi:hypothetical protein
MKVEEMGREFKRLSAVVAVSLFATVANFSSPAFAADYPPAIEVLEVGKPLTKPVPVTVPGVSAVVPVATDPVIPIVIGNPITPTSARLSTKTLTNLSVESRPVQLTPLLTIGGIGAYEKAPVATVSSSRKSEIQIPVDVPTRVVVTGLKASTTGTATLVDSRGRSVALGNIRVSASGKVTIPALTFGKKNTSYTIKLVIGGKTTTFTIRGTG